MVEQFMKSNNNLFKQDQVRFIKKYNNVTIVNMPMEFSLRLSRKVFTKGDNIMTLPFENISEHAELYKTFRHHLFFENGAWIVKE